MPRLQPVVDLPAEGTLQVETGAPSQLYREAEAAAFAGTGNRPRARIVVPPAQVEEALHLATTGKVTAKNAWSVKLIEGMSDSVGNCLEDEADQYVQFTKAAHIVEGGAKVWTHRVDSTYLLSTQMVKRLLRNDGRADEDEGDNDERPDGETRPKRKRKPLERTLAENLEEINTEGAHPLVATHIAAHQARHSALGAGQRPPSTGSKGALAAHGALFRAVTEKFDQGHAQGLLLNNTRIGCQGNLVLDRDFGVTADDAVRGGGAEDIAAPVVNVVSGARVSEQELQDAATNLLSESNVAAHAAAAAPSVDMAVPSRAPSAYAPAASDSGSNDGAADWDDGMPDPDDDAAIAEDPKFARGFVTGAAELDAIDAHYDAVINTTGTVSALAAEDPNGWVPLSQPAARQRRGIISSIGSRVTAKAANTNKEDALAARRARREKKAVQFVGVSGPDRELNTSADALVPEMSLLGPAKNPMTLLTPLGKRVEQGAEPPQAFTKYDYGLKQAQAHNLLLPESLREALPLWCGARDAGDAPSVEDFFQLFSSSASHWNLLRKTVRAPNAYQDGDRMALPVVDADHAGEFEDDDYGGNYDDGPDDNDDGLFLPPVGAAADEDPAFATEESADIDLIPEPEQMKALKVQTATAPTMVDVVKLRSTMWRRTVTLAKRGPRSEQQVLAPEAIPNERTMFSDVITSMLPDVPHIARDGTLSPAFFFFSLLFLANENSLDLRQVVGTEELERAREGIDPAGDALDDERDDDAPFARLATTAAMRRAHDDHRGGVVERVGCDVVIRLPTKTESKA